MKRIVHWYNISFCFPAACGIAVQVSQAVGAVGEDWASEKTITCPKCLKAFRDWRKKQQKSRSAPRAC
jgi:hypothetical protein